MKSLLIVLLLASNMWTLHGDGNGYLRVRNHIDKGITCYAYYRDGDFYKFYVKALSMSIAFSDRNLVDVECY